MASDKVPFEIGTGGFADSGNTDRVHFYQEFTTGPEFITQGASGWKDRRVSVDKLWTCPSTDAHTQETTNLHANVPTTCSRISKLIQGCVFEGFCRAAGNDRGQSIKAQEEKEKRESPVGWTCSKTKHENIFDETADRSWIPSSLLETPVALY